MEVIKSEKGKLPFRKYSKKEYNHFKIFSVIVFVIVLIITIYVMLKYNFILGILVDFILTFFLFIVYQMLTNELMIYLRKFLKTLDINQLEENITKINKENLHSETRKEMLLDYCNILYVYDKEKAYQIYESIDIPYSNVVKEKYELMKIVYFINKGNYELSEKLIDEIIINDKFKNKLYLKEIKLFKTIFFSEVQYIALEKKEQKSKFKNPFEQIIFYNQLIAYYIRRNNSDKAIYYAKKILEMNTNCLEINKFAEEILLELDK